MSDPAQELQRIGREIVGPAFVRFARDVELRARALRLDRLYFLARDGFVLQQLYEREGGTLPASYLYVSRLSTALPAVHELGARELALASGRLGEHGTTQLLDSLGLPHTLARPHHATPAAFVADLQARDAARVLAAGARARLRAYLAREHWFECERVGLVDIGWSGTIQDALARAFGGAGPALHGLYFALRTPDARALPEPASHKEGVFVDHRRHASLPERAVFHFVRLFEQAARAPHGTTLRYDEDGTPVVNETGRDRLAEQRSDALVEALQRGVLEATISSSPWAAIDRLVFAPTRDELDALALVAHTDDWGADSHVMLGAAAASLRQPMELWRRFHASQWKPSLLSRLDVPYLPQLYRRYVQLRGR